MANPGVHATPEGDICEVPPTIYYIPDFISKEEEEYLLRQVYAAPKPKWTQLSNRRLQNWGGLPHPRGMIAEDLPQWLSTYAKKLAAFGLFEDKVPNHVLVNEYEAGQGIMPHEDGPLYYPTVSTISLGCHTLLDFYRPLQNNLDEEVSGTTLEDRFMFSLLLLPRSLVFVCDDMYKIYLHGIDGRKTDIKTEKIANLSRCDSVCVGDTLKRSKRVSLTIRYVPNVLKAKVLLGKKR